MPSRYVRPPFCNRQSRIWLYCAAVVTAALWAIAGCSDKKIDVIEDRNDGIAQLVDADSLPRLLFDDGLVSTNNRCPVRKVKLNPKMPPVYVNGRPVGFC